MAPIRTAPSLRASKAINSEGRRNPKPPTGYTQKRTANGLESGAAFKPNYEGVHEGPGPYHYPVSEFYRELGEDSNVLQLPLPVREEMRPVDPRGPALTLNDLECVRTLGMSASPSKILWLNPLKEQEQTDTYSLSEHGGPLLPLALNYSR